MKRDVQAEGSATRAEWEQEFGDLKVIPTSYRTSPSRALLLFEHFLGRGRPLRILDAGSGIGRNALYLAMQGHTVVAVDFVDSVLAQLQESSRTIGLQQRVVVVPADLKEVLPLETSSFDLVLDSYVSCHFLDAELRSHFASEVDRVLKPNGQFLSSQFSVEDEYYRALVTEPRDRDQVVVDPRNGIAKQLYVRATAQELFSSFGKLSHFAQFDFTDFVIDRDYRRSVFVLLVEKRAA